MKWRLRLWRRKLAKLLAYKNPVSMLKGSRAGMGELRLTLSPVMVERGRDPSVAVIAFTGAEQKLMLPVYEFFETTHTLGYSRILLWDRHRRAYERGVDDTRPDFPSLIVYLKEEIERLRPQKVLCIGTSAGGHAAIRAGHELRADYVHAFGAQTGDRPPRRRARKRYRFSSRQAGLPKRAAHQFTDLGQVLKDWNQRTTYYLHYCRECEMDRLYVERLFGTPGVVSIGYPCDSHLVAVFLAKKGFLTKALEIASQDRLVKMAMEHFRDGLEVNDSRPRSASARSE